MFTTIPKCLRRYLYRSYISKHIWSWVPNGNKGKSSYMLWHVELPRDRFQLRWVWNHAYEGGERECDSNCGLYVWRGWVPWTPWDEDVRRKEKGGYIPTLSDSCTDNPKEEKNRHQKWAEAWQGSWWIVYSPRTDTRSGQRRGKGADELCTVHMLWRAALETVGGNGSGWGGGAIVPPEW